MPAQYVPTAFKGVPQHVRLRQEKKRAWGRHLPSDPANDQEGASRALAGLAEGLEMAAKEREEKQKAAERAWERGGGWTTGRIGRRASC